MRTQLLKEGMVGRRVSGKPLHQQALEAIFAYAHAAYTPYSLFVGIRLQRAEKFSRDEFCMTL